MLEQPIARGKKQRVKKKIQALKNPDSVKAAVPDKNPDGSKMDAK